MLMANEQAKAQQRQQKAQNMAAAAQTEYSPWTKMGAGELKTGAPDPTAATLQAGLTGFAQGQNIKAGMAKPEAKPGFEAPADGIAKDPYDEFLLKQKAMAK
jgi:hypothetical protein